MRKYRWIAMAAAAALFTVSFAGSAPADHIEIIGTDESELMTEAAEAAGENVAAEGAAAEDAAAADPAAGTEEAGDAGSETVLQGAGKILNPSDEGITGEEAVSGARTLYSQMQHYADVNDNSSFAALFESGADAQTVQDQLQSVKSSLSETKDLTQHADLCFYDPTQDATRSPYYFAVALCDYQVDQSGAVSWYSTLMRLAKYEDGWKVSVLPPAELLAMNYPDAFTAVSEAGGNAVDLYPSLGMRFASGAVFEGTLYALPNLLWQEEDGSVCCEVWLANGTPTSKWCDTIDLVVEDEELKDVMKVNVPVQMALEGGQSSMVTCTIPAEYVASGTKAWTQLSVSSNLKYQ